MGIAGIASGLVGKHQLGESGKQELEAIKTDFCLQLAPLIATTETTLAGHLSPWPLEPLWWHSLFFMGVPLSAYRGYMWDENPRHISVAILTYLTAETLSRTGGSAASASILKKMEITDIDKIDYAAGEYTVLSMTTGLVTSAIVYEALIHKGVESVKAGFISVVSAIVAGTLSGVISIGGIDFDNVEKNLYM